MIVPDRTVILCQWALPDVHKLPNVLLNIIDLPVPTRNSRHYSYMLLDPYNNHQVF